MSDSKKDNKTPKPLPFFRVEELTGTAPTVQIPHPDHDDEQLSPTMVSGEDWQEELKASLEAHETEPLLTPRRPDPTLNPDQFARWQAENSPEDSAAATGDSQIDPRQLTTQPLAEPTSRGGGLTELNLSHSSMDSFDHLAQMTDLVELNLSGTAIEDLTPLAGLEQLRRLNLSLTPVATIEPLRNLTQLETLDLSHTGISDLSPLKHLQQLKTLILRGAPVRKLGPLKAMVWLKKVDLKGCPVESLTPLRVIRKSAKIVLDQALIDRIREAKKRKLANMALGEWAKNKPGKK